MGLVALGKWASSSHEKKSPPLLIKNIGEQLRYTKHNAIAQQFLIVQGVLKCIVNKIICGN